MILKITLRLWAYFSIWYPNAQRSSMQWLCVFSSFNTQLANGIYIFFIVFLCFIQKGILCYFFCIDYINGIEKKTLSTEVNWVQGRNKS